MEELIWGALIGAIFGVALEHATSFFGAAALTIKYWRLRGTYGIWNPEGIRTGAVTIQPRLGNRFLTKGWVSDTLYWTGSFQFDDLFMGSARGVYRYQNRRNRKRADWGNHYLMLLENGDIAVQWHNVSHARDRKGSYLLSRESKRITCDEQSSSEPASPTMMCVGPTNESNGPAKCNVPESEKATEQTQDPVREVNKIIDENQGPTNKD